MDIRAYTLAGWLLSRSDEPLTHLKLQKLVFYGYGAAVAAGWDKAVGPLDFEAWEHGPVVRELWRTYRQYGAGTLPKGNSARHYAQPLEELLEDVLTVYGALDAWALRNQSHLETPWIAAVNSKQIVIDTHVLAKWANEKFSGPFVLPEQLIHSDSWAIERVAPTIFPSFHKAASVVREVFSSEVFV